MIFAMTTELSARVETFLQHVLDRAEARAVYLSDKGGNIIAQRSLDEYPNEENISALAAGSFFATQELARLIGEGAFHCVFHQGGTTSVYMQSLEGELLMLVVFDKESNPGLVRLYANEAATSVERLLAEADRSNEGMPAFGMEFEIDDTAQPFRHTS
jgi:predicted regulator of Ras-like GTPase activity (Roadblock/LC7/MglB family)